MCCRIVINVKKFSLWAFVRVGQTWNMKHETRFKDISHPHETLRIRTWQCTCRLSCSLSCTKSPILIGIYDYRRFSNAVQLILASLSSNSHRIRHSGEVFLREYVFWATAHYWRAALVERPTLTSNERVSAHCCVQS